MSAAAVRRRAILCVLAASSAFAVVAALIKAVGAGIPAVEVALLRSLLMAVIIYAMMRRQGLGRGIWRTKRPWGHVQRSLTGFAGMVAAYYGYSHLPLAANTALGFAMPLVLTLLSVAFLGERPEVPRIVAVFAGLAGVMIMVRPWDATASGLPLFPVLVVLAGVIAWAGAMISIRRLGAMGESNEAIILYYSVGSVLLATGFVVPVWVTPSAWQLAGLVGIGLISTLAQILMTNAYRTGEATLIAPFEYGSILYTSIIGMVVWGEFPDATSWLGIAVIIASGLYMWHRETRAGAKTG
ncbi:MAG: DMT family transporter [Alphaproteobacteria bacterium]|nr:DMT family transporter [Alphaproteobacteria bacterium]